MDAESPAVPGRRVDTALSVVIVHYETPELLRACLASLTHASPSGVSREIVVVDNSRSGEAGRAVADEFPAVRYLRPGRNVGFAGGINRGFAATSGRYVLVLNPDVVLHPGAADRLVEFLERNPDVGIAGARLLNPDGSLQLSCRTFYTLRTVLLRRTPLGRLFRGSRIVREHLLADWDHATERDVDWLLGACLVVRREAVEEVGPADERFFLYFEDVDWCYRMHQRGWRVAYVPQAVATHHHRRESAGGLTAPGLRNHVSSSLKFYEKWSLLLYLLKKNADAMRVAGLVVADFVAVAAAFLVAYGSRALAATVLTKPLYPLESYATFVTVIEAVTLLVFAAAGLYTTGRGRPRAVFGRTARASLTAGVLLMALTFVLSIKFSRVVIAVFVPVLAVAAGGVRLALASLARRAASSGMDYRRVLTVGGAAGAALIAEAVRERRDDGYALAGHLDPASARLAGESHDAILRHVLRAVRAGRVGEVVLVEPFADEALAELLARGLCAAGVSVHLAPQWRSLLGAVSRVETVAGLPLLALEPPRRERVAGHAGESDAGGGRAAGGAGAAGAAVLAFATALGLLAAPARAALPPPQSAPGASGWTTFLEPSRTVDIALTGTEVWAGTSTGLRAWDQAAAGWGSYYRSNGLPADAITAVTPDSSGRIWVATAASDLARLRRDGVVEIVSGALFGLVQLGDIRTLAISGDSLWVGARGGLALFRVGTRFSKVTLTDSTAKAQRNIRDILLRGDEIWVSTDGGVVRFANGVWTDVTGSLPVPVTGLAEGLGVVWAVAGTEGFGAVYRRDAPDTGWSGAGGAPSNVVAIAGEPERVYAATGAEVYEVATLDGVTAWTALGLPVGTGAWSLAASAGGTVWAGTELGVATYCRACEPPTPAWFVQQAPGPLAGRVPDGSGPRIAFDKGGQVWITTQRGGVAYFDGATWSNHWIGESPFDQYYWFAAFTARDSSRWFGDWGAGVVRITGRTRDQFQLEEIRPSTGGLSAVYAMSIAEDARGRLYFGYDNPGTGELFPVDILRPDGTWLHVAQPDYPIRVPRVWYIAFDASGRAWFAEKSGGVDVWDDRATDTPGDDIWVNLPSLPSADANSIVIDGARAWIGTTGGLARYATTSLNTREQLITAPSLPSTEVRALSLEPGSAGRVWVGTAGGIAVVTRDGAVSDSFTTRNSGLISNRVYALAWSPTGELWVATADGFSRYTPAVQPPPAAASAVFATPSPLSAGGGGWVSLRGFTGTARATIYRVDGRRIRTIEGVEADRPFWNGTDAAGAPLPPGPYLVHVEGTSVSARVAVVLAP